MFIHKSLLLKAGFFILGLFTIQPVEPDTFFSRFCNICDAVSSKRTVIAQTSPAYDRTQTLYRPVRVTGFFSAAFFSLCDPLAGSAFSRAKKCPVLSIRSPQRGAPLVVDPCHIGFRPKKPQLLQSLSVLHQRGCFTLLHSPPDHHCGSRLFYCTMADTHCRKIAHAGGCLYRLHLAHSPVDLTTIFAADVLFGLTPKERNRMNILCRKTPGKKADDQTNSVVILTATTSSS